MKSATPPRNVSFVHLIHIYSAFAFASYVKSGDFFLQIVLSTSCLQLELIFVEPSTCIPKKWYCTIIILSVPCLFFLSFPFVSLQAIELMIVDAMVKANNVLEISSMINDPSQYWKVHKSFPLCIKTLLLVVYIIFFSRQMQLDDTILKTIERSPDPELAEAKELILRLSRRHLYQVTFLYKLYLSFGAYLGKVSSF